MSGTYAGGKAAGKTNKAKYGESFYQRIGALGGKVKNPHKGFGADKRSRLQKLLRVKKQSSIQGAIGGTLSKRGVKHG